MGKSKVAQSSEHTIPRLELCGAVLATELETVNMDLPNDFVKFYTDSKVVLEYLNNLWRRFYNCVINPVNIIHQRSKPQQWNFVSSENNPSDLGTRFVKSVADVIEKWVSGPSRAQSSADREKSDISLIEPANDNKIKPAVKKNSLEQ